jgi:hypothetical protein
MHLLGSGVQGSVGRMGRFQHFNRAMTSAERTALFQAGVAEADRGASISTPFYTSNFSSTTDGFSANQGGVTANNTVDGESASVVWTNNGTSFSRLTRDFTTTMVRAGYQLMARVPASNTTITGVQVGFRDASNNNITPGAATNFQLAPGVWTTITGRNESATPWRYLALATIDAANSQSNNTSGDTIAFKLVRTFKIGNTVDLSPTGIQLAPGQWLDSSGNKSHVHLPDGTRLLNPATQGQVRGTNVWSASDTLQYVNNVNAVALPSNIILTLYAKATVSGTFDLGDGVDQDRYGAGVTIGTTWAPVTTLLPTHDGTNRKLTVKPTASYSGTVETTWRVEQVAT